MIYLRGGGGGASDFFLLRPDARTHSSACGARDGEPRSVNVTRRDRNDMLLCRYDQQQTTV